MLVLAILALGWLIGGGGPAIAAEKVVVAITSPQSGPQAAWGVELIRGAELALAEYDPKSLKFPYELLPTADQADPRVGITLAHKMKIDNAVLTTLKQKNPDALYLGTVFGDAALALKQMKDLGLKLTVLGPDGMYSDDLVKLAGPAAEGACATALGADVNKLSSASKFVNAF